MLTARAIRAGSRSPSSVTSSSRPDQTYLINEMMNDIRRIYTDGRDHGPKEDRYPLYNGDSIGFWDGDKLVIHTNQLTRRHLSAAQSGLHRPGRDGRNLAEDQSEADRSRCVGLRSAGARRAVVHEAVVREAGRSGQVASHPLLALRRESEQRRRRDRGRRHAVQGLHV